MSTKKYDTSVLERQLLGVVDILNDAKVPYYLEGGTLLGIVREGRLLPWDSDTDISIMRRDLPGLMGLLPKIRNLGWRLRTKKYKQDHLFAKKGLPRIIKVKDRKSLIKKTSNCLDIIIKDELDGHVYWEAADFVMKVENSYYDGFDEIEWRGRSLKAPRNYTDYLTEKYGDWSVVQKEWSCSMEQTIVS